MKNFLDIKKAVETTILNSFDSELEVGLNVFEYKNAYSHYFGNAKNTLYEAIEVDYNNGQVKINDKIYELGVSVFINKMPLS